MYDLSECSVRIPNTSISRFNPNYWKAESSGLGQLSYRVFDVETRGGDIPGASTPQIFYEVGKVEFTAITNTDHYTLKWSTEDIVSHKAMRYESNSNYFNENLIFGFEMPQATLPMSDLLYWKKYTFFRVEYSNGRSYDVPFDNFVKGQSGTSGNGEDDDGNLYKGVMTIFDFDKMTLKDVNDVSFKIRPTAISSISIVVYPECYGTGEATVIEAFEYQSGNQIDNITISGFGIAPNVGDTFEAFEQRAVISSVEVNAEIGEGEWLKVSLEETDGVTIVVPKLNARRTIALTENFRFHFVDAVSLDTPVKYNFNMYHDEVNYSTNFVNAELQAWKPLAPLISSSVTPLGITAEFDTLNGVSPRLFAQQCSALGRAQRILVKMGSENWQETDALLYQSAAKKVITPGEVNAEFKEWCLSLYNEAEAFGYDGLNIMIGTGVPADTVGFIFLDSLLQTDADGNVIPHYEAVSAGGIRLRDSLSDIVDFLYNHPDTPSTNLEVSVDFAMWRFNDYNGWINIYGDSVVDAYEAIDPPTAPTITVQPTDWTGTAGDTANFSLTAENWDSIQWQKALTEFVAPPFAGSVGTPVTSDPNWEALSSSPNNATTFYGGYMEVDNTFVGGGNFVSSVEKGELTRVEQQVYISNYTNATDQYFGIIGDGTFANRVGVFCDGISPNLGDIKMYTAVAGSFSTGALLGNIGSDIKTGTWVLTISGSTVNYDITVTNASDDSFNFTGSMVAGYNTLVDYGIYQVSNYCTTRIDYARLEGYGLSDVASWSDIIGATTIPLEVPNVGTTGDPFGTPYRCVASGAVEPDAISNTVTTIEA